jgi:peroxiredoxin
MAKEEFSIKGSIAGVETGKIYMEKMVAGKAETIDTAEVVAGKFTFTGKMPVPDFRYLRLNERDYFAQFFLENSNITVSAYKDSLQRTKIIGSQSQDDFKIYIDEMARMQKEVKALHNKYTAAVKVNNTKEADKAKIDYQALLDNSLVFLKNFVKEHPKSVVSAYVCEEQLAAQINEEELEAIVKKFPSKISTSEYVIKLKARIEEQKKIAVGILAPDFTMNDPDGKPIQLSSLRGKIVLLDFWASWCMPCRQENPNVVKLYQQYHQKGFEILGVSLDRAKEKWVKAIQDDQLTWLHVSDLKFWQNEAARLYAITVIPQSVLIGKDGKIIAKGLRGEQLEKKLAELFPN